MTNRREQAGPNISEIINTNGNSRYASYRTSSNINLIPISKTYNDRNSMNRNSNISGLSDDGTHPVRNWLGNRAKSCCHCHTFPSFRDIESAAKDYVGESDSVFNV